MNKILFLDDSKERTRIFSSWVPSALTAETAEEFINLLKQNKEIDLACLDHDLGGTIFSDSNNENCGMEVVRWICKNKPSIKNIVVHSLNYNASLEMKAKLEDCGYKVHKIDFLTLMSENNLEKVIQWVRN